MGEFTEMTLSQCMDKLLSIPQGNTCALKYAGSFSPKIPRIFAIQRIFETH